MSTWSRSTKPNGTSSYANSEILRSADLETDIANGVTAVNGNLDNANLSASAAIALTKLNDFSATDAEHTTTLNPGDSAAQILPTTGAGEIENLRYTTERLALGIAAVRVDGTGTVTAAWDDLPVRGPNLIKNPNFMGGAAATTTPPDGWTDLATGTPTFSQVALTGATLSEGKGVEARVVAGSAAVAGMTQTLSGLKASTQYLLVVRARRTTSAVHAKTTGADAASSFRNLDLSSTSTSYVTLKGVIKTDSTPTNIVVQLTTNGANADSVSFAFCGVWECGADFNQQGPTPWNVATSTTPVTISSAAFTSLGVTSTTRAPGDGMQIEVVLSVPMIKLTNNGIVGVLLSENVAGGGAAEVWYSEYDLGGATKLNAEYMFIRPAPVPGSSYVYTLSARGDAVNTATIPGATAVTGAGTKRIELKSRAVRVSQ